MPTHSTPTCSILPAKPSNGSDICSNLSSSCINGSPRNSSDMSDFWCLFAPILSTCPSRPHSIISPIDGVLSDASSPDRRPTERRSNSAPEFEVHLHNPATALFSRSSTQPSGRMKWPARSLYLRLYEVTNYTN